ncbi:MAG: ABC transporter ATP-binding protein [Myxococcales bacterium]|nr:ABC transporter ATP-binding protein [Myxococcales bacterium]
MTRAANGDVIVAQAISKRFGKQHALRGVDLRVARGAAFGLIGPNGAGKTTFIKVLLGITRPDSGQISLLGSTPEDVSARRRIGYLPENLQVPAVLSARAFLRSIARIKGLTAHLNTSESRHLVDETLHRVGLSEQAWDRRMGGFSKGMRQRTGLAAALLGQPDLLVLDEPTDGIDPLGRAAIREVIAQETRRGATVFLNSHLLAETERICDEVAIMADGRIARVGALDGLRSRDRYCLTLVANDCATVAVQSRGWAMHTRPDGMILSTINAAGPAALSQTLAALLTEGVLIAEVQHDVRALEDVLAEAVGDNQDIGDRGDVG